MTDVYTHPNKSEAVMRHKSRFRYVSRNRSLGCNSGRAAEVQTVGDADPAVPTPLGQAIGAGITSFHTGTIQTPTATVHRHQEAVSISRNGTARNGTERRAISRNGQV